MTSLSLRLVYRWPRSRERETTLFATMFTRCAVRFAIDSPLEETGFELFVSPGISALSELVEPRGEPTLRT